MALIAIPRRVPWRRKPPSPRTRSNGLAAGLLAAYPFHERAGSVITDVRRGKTGTLSDGTWTATERGYVYDLNGSSRYADISGHFVASDFASGKYTILCWAYARSFPSWATIFKNWATNKGFAHLGQDDVSNKLSLYVAESGGTQKGPAIMSGTMPTNKWFFVAAVADGANFTVYQDLVQGSSVAYNGTLNVINECAIGAKKDSTVIQYWNGFVDNVLVFNDALPFSAITAFYENDFQVYQPRTQLIFIPSGGALSLSSAAILRDSDKAIATQQKTVSVDALIRAADLLIGTPQKSLSVDALLADADNLSAVSRHEATIAAQLLDGDVSIAPAQKAGSISGLLRDSDRAIGISSKAALITGLLLDGDLLTALGSQIETHQSAGVLSGADVLIAGVTTNRTVSGKAQDGDALTVASAIDRLSAALGIDADTMTSASTSARSIGALIIEGDAAVAGIQSGRLQPALLIDGDILIITSSTVAQADLAGRINLSGRYAPQVSLVGVYAPAINLKGRVH